MTSIESTNQQFYVNNYIKFAWIIISAKNSKLESIHKFHEFNKKYGNFLKKLIENSQLTYSNLIISLYYLYKYYNYNDVINHKSSTIISNQDEDNVSNIVVEESTDYSLIINLIIVSLILSNKSFDDQSYTLKTWLIIINNSMGSKQNGSNHHHQKKLIKIDLKLINSIESYFLCSLNYNLSFIHLSQDFKFWNVLIRNGIFKLTNSILNKFKALVELTSTSTTTISTPIIKPRTPAPIMSIKNLEQSCSSSSLLLTPLIHNFNNSSPLSVTSMTTPATKKGTSSITQLPLPITSSVSPLSTSCYSPLTPLTPYSDVKRRKLPLHHQLYTYSFKHHYKAPPMPALHHYPILQQQQQQQYPVVPQSYQQFPHIQGQQQPNQLPIQLPSQQHRIQQLPFALPSQPVFNPYSW
ncbi:hypothetical protein DFJ63DRAFT_333753 [Scheffersomyces coipomensis]|uniref:uncharacterized protein n=1 Tax=Scheffersomyces coipomensis TaxID=1788519 RepID=UPI00315CB646